MNSVQARKCQSCKKDFFIEPDDFGFYEKIGVPPPTWCPDCRFVRRLIWRNDRNLVKRQCDLCKKETFSMYDVSVPFPVYCPECWRSDAWDPLEYGRDYDFSRPFFDQYRELMSRVPQPSLGSNGNNLNWHFANMVEDVKNVYFSFSIIYGAENIYYSNNVDNSREIFDSFNVSDSEIVYESIGSVKNYRSNFCYWSSGCVDSWFMLDCSGCSNCFGCVGLRNKKYCVFNEEYSKEEYEMKLKSFNLGSHKAFGEFEKKFEEHALRRPRKYARIISSPGSSGDEILNSKNIVDSFNVVDGTEDCKYLYRSLRSKQCMDASYLGSAELVYEHTMGGSDLGKNLKFVVWGAPGQQNVSYSNYCGSSSNLFGCVGMRSKQYCVLNKQYSKEEYEELVSKIISHMDEMPHIDKLGRVYKYGEFFPPDFSPFAYNESVIQELHPLTREEAESKGFRWKDRDKSVHKITLQSGDLPDHIKDVQDSITKEVIGCPNAGKESWCIGAFRIIPEELAFYRRIGVPLPRYCINCRHFNRLKKRNPLQVRKRQCGCAGATSENNIYKNTASHFHGADRCPNKFETPYSPDRPEIVYCEACYNSEVV